MTHPASPRPAARPAYDRRRSAPQHSVPYADRCPVRRALLAFPFVVAAPGVALVGLTGEPLAALPVLAGIGAAGLSAPHRRSLAASLTGLIVVLASTVAMVGGHQHWPYIFAGAAAMLVSAVATAFIRRHDINRLNSARRDLAAAEAGSVLDKLTGLANRQGLLLLAGPMLEQARRKGDAVHCVVVAVDGLNVVTESMGPEAGDDILVAVSGALRAVTRSTDVVGRWDTNELCVVGPGAGMSLTEIERRVRDRLRDDPPVDPASWEPKVTAGSAVLAPWDEGDLSGLVRKANVESHARRALRSTNSRRRQAGVGQASAGQAGAGQAGAGQAGAGQATAE